MHSININVKQKASKMFFNEHFLVKQSRLMLGLSSVTVKILHEIRSNVSQRSERKLYVLSVIAWQ
jgi:hypothetical protein